MIGNVDGFGRLHRAQFRAYRLLDAIKLVHARLGDSDQA